MKENQINVVIKRPGYQSFTDPLFDNTLEAFQKAVGGYIETVTLCSDLIIVCNEEGRIRGLPYNTTIAGIDFYGTIIAVSKRRDEFASIKMKNLPFVTKLMEGRMP